MFSAASRSLTPHVSQLTTLSRLRVPDFHGNIAALVTLRNNADVFHQWRAALTGALERVAEVPNSDDGIQAATDILRSELDQSLLNVKREAARSSAIRTLVSGAKGLALTGIGAVTGAVVTTGLGNPASGSLVGAASGAAIKASESVITYFSGLQERSRARAIWDVMLSFRDADHR